MIPEDLIYEIDPSLIDGAGAESVSPGKVMKMDDEEKKNGSEGFRRSYNH